MIEIIKELNIEVSKPNVFQAVVAKQYDMNTRFIKATFVDNGKKIYIDPNATVSVVINAYRPDGKSKGFKGEVNADDGTVTVPLHSWMLEQVGTVVCDISVIDVESGDNKKLTTTSFNLIVERAAYGGEDITSDPQYDILVELASMAANGGTSSSQSVNVKTLGAKGDGVTDDSAIIQQAINEYATIIIPEGTYRVKGITLRSGVKIVGENATLKITDNCDLSDVLDEDGNFVSGSFAPIVFYIKGGYNDVTHTVTPISDIEISGIHFDGNAAHFFAPVTKGGRGADTVAKFNNDGILLYNAENITIHHCTFNNFKGRGIAGAIPSYSGKKNAYCVHDLHVYDCVFNDGELPYKEVVIGSGEKYPDGTTSVASGTYHIYPTSNAIQIVQSGESACNQDIIVERCTVHKSPNYGFMFYPSTQRLTVRDCVIKDCGLYTSEEANEEGTGYIDYGYYRREVTGDDKGDHQHGGCIKLNCVRDAVIENNYLYGARGSNISIHNGADLELGGTALAWPAANNILITGNTIVGNAAQRRAGHGVYVEAGSDIKIIGNTILDQVGKGQKHFVWNKAVDDVSCIIANVPILVSENIIKNGNTAVSLFSGRVVNNDISEVKYGVYACTVTKSGVTYTAEDLLILGNKIIGSNPSWDMGVQVQNSNRVIICGNVIRTFTQGVRNQYGSNNLTVYGNIFEGCNRGICSVNNVAEVKHDAVNIYGNTFIGIVGTVIWENTYTSPASAFVPTNSKVDFVEL